MGYIRFFDVKIQMNFILLLRSGSRTEKWHHSMKKVPGSQGRENRVLSHFYFDVLCEYFTRNVSGLKAAKNRVPHSYKFSYKLWLREICNIWFVYDLYVICICWIHFLTWKYYYYSIYFKHKVNWFTLVACYIYRCLYRSTISK